MRGSDVKRFRIKVASPCHDCHYFYSSTREEAEAIIAELCEDLAGLGCRIWIYAETRYGHVRIDNQERVT
jgi:hypothetical protein